MYLRDLRSRVFFAGIAVFMLQLVSMLVKGVICNVGLVLLFGVAFAVIVLLHLLVKNLRVVAGLSFGVWTLVQEIYSSIVYGTAITLEQVVFEVLLVCLIVLGLKYS